MLIRNNIVWDIWEEKIVYGACEVCDSEAELMCAYNDETGEEYWVCSSECLSQLNEDLGYENCN